MTIPKKKTEFKKTKDNNLKPKVQDDKLKPLMPTLRQKKRFILVKIESMQKLEFKELSENIVDEIIIYLGAIEFAKSGIWILRDKYNFEKQEFLIRCSLKTKDKLLGTLCLINKLGKEKVKLNVLRVSGTIKGSLRDTEIKGIRNKEMKNKNKNS